MSESSLTHYVGLDVHQKRSSICILDRDGKQVKRLEVKGTWARVVEAVARQVPGPFSVCYEASCGYGYLYEKLAPLARHVAVAHPASSARSNVRGIHGTGITCAVSALTPRKRGRRSRPAGATV